MGSTTNLAKDSKDKDKDKDGSNECVILLADADLMQLPLESLSSLQADGIAALSRDFSLQFLYHRMRQGLGTGGSREPAEGSHGAGKMLMGAVTQPRRFSSCGRSGPINISCIYSVSTRWWSIVMQQKSSGVCVCIKGDP